MKERKDTERKKQRNKKQGKLHIQNTEFWVSKGFLKRLKPPHVELGESASAAEFPIWKPIGGDSSSKSVLFQNRCLLELSF